ncbi:MAG: hypothetical protein JXQ72_04075, partial [Anaerolineae bacterium]|nr:hypothetical protein [Anaerolineae bacterium]
NPTGPISINENGVAQLRFRITDQPTADVTFPISTDDTSECVIGAGVTSVTFPVATWDSAVLVFVGGVQDMLVDGDQPCNIITGDPTSADASYNVLTAADTPNVATTIVDIDAPGIFVAVSGSTTITEGNTRDLGFWVGTQPTGGADVTFPVSVSDPTQCEIAGGITSMTILNANWNVPAANAITINAFDNDIVDGSRPCNLITGDPTSGDAYYDGLGAADSPDVLITISDEDSAAVRIVPSTIAATEGGANGTFTVVLDSQPVANVTIGLTFATGEAALVDVTPALPFTAADWNVPRTFQIQAVDDAALEGPHTDTITVISSSTDPNYGSAVTYIGGLGAASNEVTVNITDNDMPGIAVNPVALTISEPNETDTFNIALSTMPSDNVSVGLSVSDPSECSVTPASVTIIPSAWTTGANVTVQAVDDAIMDGDQTCTVITAPAVSTDAGYNGVDPANVVVTVLDDETPRDTDEDDDGAGSTGPTAEDVARAQAPLCGDITGATNPIVRASVPGGTVPGGGVYCRVLAESGSYAVPYSAAEIGNMDVINMGVIHAVDVFGMAGSTPVPNWMSSISVCLQGTGRMMLLDATTAPRALSLLSSWQSGGYTCATLYNAGTVVLVP